MKGQKDSQKVKNSILLISTNANINFRWKSKIDHYYDLFPFIDQSFIYLSSNSLFRSWIYIHITDRTENCIKHWWSIFSSNDCSQAVAALFFIEYSISQKRLFAGECISSFVDCMNIEGEVAIVCYSFFVRIYLSNEFLPVNFYRCYWIVRGVSHCD